MSGWKARIARTAAVLFAATVAVFGSVIPASANIDTSSVKVTDPIQSEVLAGTFDENGDPMGFKVSLKGQATTSCGSGWQTVKFTVSGPSGTQVFNVTAPSTATWSGAAPSQWDTAPLKNGIYTVRLDVVEKDTISLACNGQAASHYITAKVANPAHAPSWASVPAAASDGSASVTLRWNKNAAVDVQEYRIVRSGPDGIKVAPVSAASPGGQGCSVSGNVYSCVDTSFPSAYSGNYTYGLVALRERPAYNSNETEKLECLTVSKPCVVSAGSETHSVSLVAPTPTPTPTDQPSTPPPGNGTPGTPSSKPSAGGTTTGGTRVLSSGGSNDFYSGTYSETLPYTPRTLILGGGSATSSPQASGYQGDVVSETAPDYRTIVLPVAGGLLAFLSAAHVRRLLLHL
ncbi:MAG: hypothetical protein ACRDJ1_10715 [Actinomycetota bacterium]